MRYGETLYRPRFGPDERTITFGKSGTTGFLTNVNITPEEFETDSVAYIGMLPNSSSPEYTGTIVENILVSNRLKWIPCKRMSDNVIGYYEFYTKRFIEKTGNGIPTTSGYDNTYYDELFVDGTSEVIILNSQTANAENLFAINTFKDEQDVISGNVIRKIGVKVLDGTENWVSGGINESTFYLAIDDMKLFSTSDRGNLLCSHFSVYSDTPMINNTIQTNQLVSPSGRSSIIKIKNDSITPGDSNDFKRFLSEEYNAGTPVIVLYVLDEEITEQVTAQSLNTIEGDDVVTVTAEVSNIPLEVKYKRT